MDDELKAYLEGMEGRLVKMVNDQHERLIEQMKSLARDFQNTKAA